jgi:hypothetical protein
LDASVDFFDINLFTTFSDPTIIDKFLGNDFINYNMRFIVDELNSVNTKVSSAFDRGIIYNLSDYLVNNLCKSVLILNKTENILEISPGYKSTRVDRKLGELQVLYDEEAFNVSTIQDIATPDCKLYYPEPFIASPSFTHEEI